MEEFIENEAKNKELLESIKLKLTQPYILTKLARKIIELETHCENYRDNFEKFSSGVQRWILDEHSKLEDEVRKLLSNAIKELETEYEINEIIF